MCLDSVANLNVRCHVAHDSDPNSQAIARQISERDVLLLDHGETAGIRSCQAKPESVARDYPT